MQKTSFSDAQDVNTSTSKAHVPAHNLITIPPSWPFTKWMEYKPIIKISADRAVDFICDILYRFDFSHTIITDLGSNFTSQSFWEFCENACIDVKYVSIAHPRANGQVERIDGQILYGLKKRVYDANTKKGGKWIYEQRHVIWGCALSPARQQVKPRSS